MTRIFRMTVLFCVFLFFLSGCTSYQVRLTDEPAGTNSVGAATLEDKKPVVINEIKATFNGIDTIANMNLTNRFITKLRETNLFSDIACEKPSDNQNSYFIINIIVNERYDQHAGSNFLRSAFVGISLGILSPVLQMQYDMDEEMIVEVIRPDNKTKKYFARARGTAYVSPFAPVSQAIVEMSNKVAANTLNSIMYQMSENSDFYNGK